MRELHHRALLAALEVIPPVDEEWAAATGRASGGLLRMEGDSEARTGVLTLGSIFGTLADANIERYGLRATAGGLDTESADTVRRGGGQWA
jgi:pyruvate ferredoxin oxidoreductase alpha subunit